MGLQYTGEVLAVSTERVTPRPGQNWEPFISTSIVCMDDGKVTELRAGRDLDGAALRRLEESRGKGRVVLEVSPYNGRFYVESIASVAAPAVKSA